MNFLLLLRRLVLRPVVPLAVLLVLVGCSAPIRQLHPVGANEFTLFPNDRGQPPPITCSGSIDERWACFAGELKQQGQKLDVSGAFALSTPDGKIRSFTRTDQLNAKALVVGEDTRFPAASVTKMFIAAAAVSLSEDGSLDLQQPISRYLPELTGNDGVGTATLHQLLTHTSGLGSPEPMCEKGDQDLPALLDKYGKQPLLVAPGAVFNYSNLGYSFVAGVLERVTGQPFERVVAERVLIPAGIPGASFGPDQVAVRGQRPDESEVPPHCRAAWPAGGLVLSVRELAQWAGQMARPESSKLRGVLEVLMAPQVTMDDRPGAAYGYGVRRFEHGGLTIFNHPGGMANFSSFVAWSPARGLGVAVFANRVVPLTTVGFRALSTFLSIPEDWQPPPGPAHPLSAYVGVYVDRVGTLGRLRVSLEEGDLVMDYLDALPPLLPPGFRFVFEPGAERPRYVVTPVGVGERSVD
jgi:CubicO group peptidase (beta-lactamase class C family)